MSHPCHTLSNPSAQLFWCRHCMKIFEDPIQRWRHSKTCKKLVTSNPEQRILSRDGRTLEVRAGNAENLVIVSDLKPQKEKNATKKQKNVSDLNCYICKKEFDSFESMKEHVKRSCNRPETGSPREPQSMIPESPLLIRTNNENVSSQIESLLKAAQEQQQQEQQKQQQLLLLQTHQERQQQAPLEEPAGNVPLELLANASLLHKLQEEQMSFSRTNDEQSESDIVSSPIETIVTDISEPMETVITEVHIITQDGLGPDMQVDVQEDTNAADQTTFIPPRCRLPESVDLDCVVKLEKVPVPISTKDHECVFLNDGTVAEGESNILLPGEIQAVMKRTKAKKPNKKRKGIEDNVCSVLKSKKAKTPTTRQRTPVKEISGNVSSLHSFDDIHGEISTNICKDVSKSCSTSYQENTIKIIPSSPRETVVNQNLLISDLDKNDRNDGLNEKLRNDIVTDIDNLSHSEVPLLLSDEDSKTIDLQKESKDSNSRSLSPENEKSECLQNKVDKKEKEEKQNTNEHVSTEMCKDSVINKSKEEKSVIKEITEEQTNSSNSSKKETKENHKISDKKMQPKKKPDKPAKCKICDREFKSMQTLQKHNKVPCKIKHTRNLTQKVLRPKKTTIQKTPIPEPKKKKPNNKTSNNKPKLLLTSNRRYSDTNLSFRSKKGSKSKNRRKSAPEYNFNFSCCKQYGNRNLDTPLKYEDLSEKEQYFFHLEMIPITHLPSELRPFHIAHLHSNKICSAKQNNEEDICDRLYLPPPVLEKMPDIDVLEYVDPVISSVSAFDLDLEPPVLEAISEMDKFSNISEPRLLESQFQAEDEKDDHQTLSLTDQSNSYEDNLKENTCESPSKRVENRHFLDVIAELSPNSKKKLCNNAGLVFKTTEMQVNSEDLSPSKYSNNRHFTDVIGVRSERSGSNSQDDDSGMSCKNLSDGLIVKYEELGVNQTDTHLLEREKLVTDNYGGEISDLEPNEKKSCKVTIGIQTEVKSPNKLIYPSSSALHGLNFQPDHVKNEESQLSKTKPQVRNLFDSFSNIRNENDNITSKTDRPLDHQKVCSSHHKQQVFTSALPSNIIQSSTNWNVKAVQNVHVNTASDASSKITENSKSSKPIKYQEIMVYPPTKPDPISKPGPALETNVIPNNTELLGILAKSLGIYSETQMSSSAQKQETVNTSTTDTSTTSNVLPASLTKAELGDGNVQIIILNNSASTQDYTTDINIIDVPKVLPSDNQSPADTEIMQNSIHLSGSSSRNIYVPVTDSYRPANHVEAMETVNNIASNQVLSSHNIPEPVTTIESSSEVPKHAVNPPGKEKETADPSNFILKDFNVDGVQIIRLGKVEELEHLKNDMSEPDLSCYTVGGSDYKISTNTIILPPTQIQGSESSSKTVQKMKSILPHGLSFLRNKSADTKYTKPLSVPITIANSCTTVRLQGPSVSDEKLNSAVGVQVVNDCANDRVVNCLLNDTEMVCSNSVIPNDNNILQDGFYSANTLYGKSASTNFNSDSPTSEFGANLYSSSELLSQGSLEDFAQNIINSHESTHNLHSNYVSEAPMEEPRVMVQYIEQVHGTQEVSYVYLDQSAKTSSSNFVNDATYTCSEEMSLNSVPVSYTL